MSYLLDYKTHPKNFWERVQQIVRRNCTEIITYSITSENMEQIGNTELKSNPSATTISDIPAEMVNIRQAKKKRRSILKVSIDPSSEREALKVSRQRHITFMDQNLFNPPSCSLQSQKYKNLCILTIGNWQQCSRLRNYFSRWK